MTTHLHTVRVPRPICELVWCNTCQQWSQLPYRNGKCASCQGVWVGGVKVCCGDCDVHPCECPRASDARASDADVAWLPGKIP